MTEKRIEFLRQALVRAAYEAGAIAGPTSSDQFLNRTDEFVRETLQDVRRQRDDATVDYHNFLNRVGQALRLPPADCNEETILQRITWLQQSVRDSGVKVPTR